MRARPALWCATAAIALVSQGDWALRRERAADAAPGQGLAEPESFAETRTRARAEADQPLNPDCSRCRTKNDKKCCSPVPSEMGAPKCSTRLPYSLVGDDVGVRTSEDTNTVSGTQVRQTIWEMFATKDCYVADALEGERGPVSETTYCDPCRVAGVIVRAAGQLYCDPPDNENIYLTCFNATPKEYQFTCQAGNPAYDAFGGWQRSAKHPPACPKAHRDREFKWKHKVREQGRKSVAVRIGEQYTQPPEIIEDLDCKGEWSLCTSFCEVAADRVFDEVQAPTGSGKPCPPAEDCKAGESECPSWLKLQSKEINEDTPNKITDWQGNNGKGCPRKMRVQTKDDCFEALQKAGLDPKGDVFELTPPRADYPIGCSMRFIESADGGGWDPKPYFNAYNGDEGDGCAVQQDDGGYCVVPCRNDPNPEALSIDCDGSWSACTEACEKADARTFSMSQEKVGAGNDCPVAEDCQAGWDDCPRWIQMDAKTIKASSPYTVTEWTTKAEIAQTTECSHDRRASKDQCVAALKGAGLKPSATLNVLNPPDPAYPIGCSMVYLNKDGGGWDATPIWNAYSGNAVGGGDGCYIADEEGGKCAIPCKETISEVQKGFNDDAEKEHANGGSNQECSGSGAVTLAGDNSENAAVDMATCAQRCYVKDDCNFFTVLAASTTDIQGECKGFTTCDVSDRVACSATTCRTRTV